MKQNKNNIDNDGLVLLNEESNFLNLFFTEDENCCAKCSYCPKSYQCSPCVEPTPD